MISNKFLAPQLQVAGLEFMDFQSKDFFNEIVAVLAPMVVDGQLHEVPAATHRVIEKYCGFANLKFNLIDYGNLAIDTGYVSPGNILNSKGIEYYFPKGQTNLYRWFTQNQSNLLRGSIDFKTGKVGGAYAELPFELYINTDLRSFISGDDLDDQTITEMLAGFLTHELGHAFSGIFAIHRFLMDSYAITAALHFLSHQEYGQTEVAIYKDACRLMEIEEKQIKDLQKIAESGNEEIIVASLTKLAQQRTQMNSQSLGVDEMNSEVLADVYAVRMGCDKHLIDALKRMDDSTFDGIGLSILFNSLMTAIFFTAFVPALAVFLGVFVLASGFMSLMLFNMTMSSDIYDTSYRRLLNVHQEQIARLKQNKTLSANDRRKMLADLDKNLKLIKENKPFFEDTAVQRVMQWLFQSSTSNFDALEHYTKILLNNEMSIVNAKIQQLGNGA
ncbi:hypothetical protein [Vibrio phage VP4B]|uniref:Virion structural protein n=1 Tax=Vibrio phage VP4B TaxID=1262540 RepID=V9LZE2_9CAUD|nr:hypothetical protein FDJ61_gp108 [Vibrio phage VP4B]AGB07222.1 hypothetical protein [Vibrio phage VP4B]